MSTNRTLGPHHIDFKHGVARRVEQDGSLVVVHPYIDPDSKAGLQLTDEEARDRGLAVSR